MVGKTRAVIVIDAEDYIVKNRQEFKDVCVKIKEYANDETHEMGKAHVVHVVMVKGHLPSRSESLTVLDPKKPKDDRQLVSIFKDDGNPVFKKNRWNCTYVNGFCKIGATENKDLLDYLCNLYDNYNARIFEFVGFYGDCCVTSSAKGVSRFFKKQNRKGVECHINLQYCICGLGEKWGPKLVHRRTCNKRWNNITILPPLI